jgi:hypothetical protein
MLLAVAAMALLPAAPGTILRETTNVTPPPSFDRRKALGIFAASLFPASVFPLAAQSVEPRAGVPDFEEVYTTEAGIAQIGRTVEQAAKLVEELDLDQLQLLLRSPVMVSFLGYEPVPYEILPNQGGDRADSRALEQQLKLIQAFPASSRRKAAEGLSGFLSQVRTLDRACLERDANVDRLRECAEEARQQAAEITKLYYAAGCMVCSEPVRSVIASDATWDNPNLARLDEFEPRLNRRPQRTEQEEKLARSLGFRPD